MSINFATLQGLTIPEGVVTQITDASGRVLWSAVKIEGVFYMRPSADISLEHAITPDTILAGYLAICEEVSDGTSTYITTPTDTGLETATSKFKLSAVGDIPNLKKATITGVELTLVRTNTGASAGTVVATLEVNGINVGSVSAIESKTTAENIVTAITPINSYLAANGVLPDINVVVTSQNAEGKSVLQQPNLTQLYVVVAYEG